MPRSGRAPPGETTPPGGPPILLTTINAKWIHPSLALRLLKANLGRWEGACEILELNLRQSLAEKLKALQGRRPAILGISLAIWNHGATLELLEALEGAWETGPAQGRPVVVLGGPEASYLPEETAIFRRADYVIRGEGEAAFRELCGTLLGPGAAEDKGRSPAPRAPRFINGAPADLAGIRQAYHYYSAEDLERKLVYVESGRGCPFRCGFCQSAAAGLGWGPAPGGEARTSPAPQSGVRDFPLAPFLAEMDSLIRRGARNFKFLDRSFNADPGRALAIIDFFLDCAGTPPQAGRPLCVHFEMVPGAFPPALREKLRRFPPGTLRLEVGIQTLNPQAAALINRSGGEEEALEVLSFLREETAATVHADLIAALPGETIGSFAAGFDRLWLALSGPAGPGQGARPGKGGRFEIQLGILKVLPGTPLARRGPGWGIHHSPAPPYEALSTAALSQADLDRIKNFARFWELLINRRPFPELPIAPAGEPVFWRFMELSAGLLARFGRNWGIDRRELGTAVAEALTPPVGPYRT